MRALAVLVTVLLVGCGSDGPHYAMLEGCTPGEKVDCECGSSLKGTATCNEDGQSISYCGHCGETGAGGSAGTTGTGGAPQVCAPGAKLPCQCASGAQGTATCDATGTSIGMCEGCAGADAGDAG